MMTEGNNPARPLVRPVERDIMRAVIERFPFEADCEWQTELGRDLQAAGIEVDLKKISELRKKSSAKTKSTRS